MRQLAPIPLDHFPGHWIESVGEDGEILKLEDGSLWRVDGVDTVTSKAWFTCDDQGCYVADQGKLADSLFGRAL